MNATIVAFWLYLESTDHEKHLTIQLERRDSPTQGQRPLHHQIHFVISHKLLSPRVQTMKPPQSVVVAYSSQYDDKLVNQPILRHPKSNNRDTSHRSHFKQWT